MTRSDVAAPAARGRILTTALDLMSAQGYAGTSMRTIAGACDLNVATLYHYFPSKADLLRAVVRERWYPDRFTSQTPDVDPQLPPQERLVAMMTRLWQAALGERRVLRLVLIEGMRGDPLCRDVADGLVTAADESIARWLAQLFPELTRGRRRAARLLRALLEAAVVDALSSGGYRRARGRLVGSTGDLGQVLLPTP